MIALVSVKTYLCTYPVIGRDDRLSDPAFNTLVFVMENRSAVLAAPLAAWARTRPITECEDAMSEAGVLCTAYRTLVDQLANSHLKERGSFQGLHEQAFAARASSLLQVDINFFPFPPMRCV